MTQKQEKDQTSMKMTLCLSLSCFIKKTLAVVYTMYIVFPIIPYINIRYEQPGKHVKMKNMNEKYA